MSVDFFPKFDKVKILEQNEDFLIINKPSGLLVHPVKCHPVAISPEAKLFNRVNPDKYSKEQTLIEVLLKTYPEISGVGQLGRDGIVHRLDKDVSGIMVVAKTQKMYDFLIEQFQENKVKKQYLALVYGQPPKNKGIIDLPLGRNKKGKIIALTYRKQIKQEKSAITEYEIKENFDKFSLLKINLLTGRTHQIRVHLRSIRCPIVGDQKYKLRDKKLKSPLELNRIFLHSNSIGFYNLERKWQEIECALPLELEDFLNKIRKN
ncbi:RNA pseudouridine synthase [Patescibacteria group bacterium]|nr:RNA pseudouridine synthase [Patescibacteria group bacterium]